MVEFCQRVALALELSVVYSTKLALLRCILSAVTGLSWIGSLLVALLKMGTGTAFCGMGKHIVCAALLLSPREAWAKKACVGFL